MAEALRKPRPRQPRDTGDSKTRLIRAVRAACARLGLDDDDRRDIQLALVKKRSLSDMTLAEIGIVLDQLNKDWKGPSGHGSHIGKIRALWWSLYWLGLVASPDDGAIDSFVRKQTGISALRFLNHRRAASVVEPLKSWLAREGVAWDGEADLIADRRAVARAIWQRLRSLGLPPVPDLGWEAYLRGAVSISAREVDWSRHEWDAIIRHLGKMLRRKLARP